MLARAVRAVDVAVADDGRSAGRDVVDFAQPGDEAFQGVNLCRRRDFFIEIPRDVDADGVVILPFGMGTDRCQGRPRSMVPSLRMT